MGKIFRHFLANEWSEVLSKGTVDKLWANSNCVGTTSVLSRKTDPLVNKKDQSQVLYVDDFDQTQFKLLNP